MKVICSFWLSLFCYSVTAQTLTGKVTDGKKKPITGAHILNVTAGTHANTDNLGFFTLNTYAPEDSIRVSHIGYEIMDTVLFQNSHRLEIVLEEKWVMLEEIQIEPEIDALNLITQIDTRISPVKSSQEILTQVPGLFIGQHAGGGKAEQIFLRGFDVDHGTDVAVQVDGMPVNMVSHAHGQGYADLHFVIPETIENIKFGKGTYYADKGNFNTAGYVDFNTKNSLDNSLIKFEKGQFNSQRILGMLNLKDDEKQSAYVAAEYLRTDGPFDSPQNFNRTNFLAKYTTLVSRSDQLAVSLSHFHSQWDASGQVPQRAIENGIINRFGAIDDTEGGSTSRNNVQLNYDKSIDNQSSINTSLYYSQYDFELYSNFTFFHVDPINGDQIRQKEFRDMMGLTSRYSRVISFAGLSGYFKAGISFRKDLIKDNELSWTTNRTETREPIQFGDINETNLGHFVDLTIDMGKWAINPGLRMDQFQFSYRDMLANTYEKQVTNKSILSPKLNILYNHSGDMQLFVKAGKGFHANDSRVSVARSGRQSLPAAYGYDLGFIWKPFPKLIARSSYWFLFLEQEFVYVGDAGIVEPSGRTRRLGVDLNLRYQPVGWFYGTLDANYAHARSIDEEPGHDYVPLAPDFTLTAKANIQSKNGLHGSLNYRFIGDRPAKEDNTIVAEGYGMVDLNIGYKGNNIGVGIQIRNLLNVAWNETQFATESRLFNETESVEEIHLTPGTPFFIKASLSYTF